MHNYYEAGITNTQDFIARTLALHPEMVYVTDTPITIRTDGEDHILVNTLPEELHDCPFYLSFEDTIENEEIVLLMNETYRNSDQMGKLAGVCVYKNAKIGSVRTKYKSMLQRLKGFYEDPAWTWIERFREDKIAANVSKKLGIPEEYIVIINKGDHLDLSFHSNLLYVTPQGEIKNGDEGTTKIMIAFSRKTKRSKYKLDAIYLSSNATIAETLSFIPSEIEKRIKG